MSAILLACSTSPGDLGGEGEGDGGTAEDSTTAGQTSGEATSSGESSTTGASSEPSTGEETGTTTESTGTDDTGGELEGCDPTLQNCGAGQGCYPGGDPFACTADASGSSGAYGDTCDFINACDPGLFCATADDVPGCVGQMCCTEFCDLGGGTCTGAPMQQCIPWTDDPKPGLEHVGACMVP